MATDAGVSSAPSLIFDARAGLNITVDTAHGAPVRALDGSDPRIIDLWDAWFDEMSRGVRSNGAFHFQDAGAAQLFTKYPGTVRATRRIVVDVFGEARLSQADGSPWTRFNDTRRALPNNHGHPHIHMIVQGGGPSFDGTRWVACRPGFFLHVRALSRLFRRLFLEGLRDLHLAGQLTFFAELVDVNAFTARLAPFRKSEWVVYAKPPFGGPEAVLAI